MRPNMTLAVKRLIRDLARRLPELSHVRASRVLVVAGEARRASRGTIRPTIRRGKRGRRPEIRIAGKRILYVITLRPLWFVGSTPEQRIATVLHELYHVSARFDGTLHAGRRHAKLPRARYDRKIRALRDRYLARAPAEIVEPFAHEGTVRARMWLERPAPTATRGARALYGEAQLFLGLMPMRPPRRAAKRKGRATPPSGP
jgi:predicted metallopeptidase